jgi:hypothetical protein
MGDTETRSFGQQNVKGYGATAAPYQADMEDVEYNDERQDEERGTSSEGVRHEDSGNPS